MTNCGGNYMNTSGIIMSPSHPHHYPHMADCIYLISQPNGTYINVSFISLDIVCQDLLAESDYIELRDGNSENSPLMGIFCGSDNNVPVFMQTNKNFLRIR